MRIIIRLIVITLFLTFAGLIIPVFIDFNSYKPQIQEAVRAATGRNLLIEGEITGALLPYPRITLQQIELEALESEDDALIEARKCTLSLAIFPLLTGNLKPTAITFDQAELHLAIVEGKKNWDFSEYQKAGNISLPLHHVTLNKSEISLHKNDEVLLNYVPDITISLEMDAAGAPVSFEGHVDTDREVVEFSGSSDEDDGVTNLSVTARSPSFNLVFDGKNADKNGVRQTTGTVKVKGYLKQFASNYLVPMDAVFLHIKTGETAEITGDISSTGSEFSVSNIVVASESIKAAGSLKIAFETVPLVDLDLKVSSLNIDQMMRAPAEAEDSKSGKKSLERELARINNSRKENPVMGFLSKSFNGLVYLEIDEITLYGQKITKNIFNAELFDGEIEIYPSMALLPGNVPVEMSGNISHNKIRPIFDGIITIRGDNLYDMLVWGKPENTKVPEILKKRFSFKSHVAVTPKEIRILSLDGVIDNTDISGLLSIRHGGAVPALIGTVTASHVNLDALGVPSMVYESSIQPMLDYSQSSDFSSFQWLRSIDYKLSLETNLTDVTLNKKPVKNLSGIVSIEPGILKIDKFSIDSESANFGADVMLDMRALWPNVKLSVEGDYLDTAFFTPFIPADAKVEPVPVPVAAVAVPGAAPLPPKPVPSTTHWSTEKFKFIRVDKLKGTFKIALDNYIHKAFQAKKLKTSLTMADNILTIDEFTGDIFSGKVTVKGAMTLGVNVPSISVVFALQNIKIEETMKLLGLQGYGGYLSLSGSLRTQGESPLIWASSLQSSISMAAREVVVEGVDYHKLIESTLSMKTFDGYMYNKHVLTAFNSGSTVFANVDGSLKIETGVIDLNDFIFDTYRIKGIMGGKVSIRDWIISVASNIAFVPKASTPPITIGVTLKGPIDKMEKKIDAAALENFVKTMPPAQ